MQPSVRLLTPSSTASSHRLPVVAQHRRGGDGRGEDLPGSDAFPSCVMGSQTTAERIYTLRSGAQHIAFDVLNRLGLCEETNFSHGSISRST